MKQCLRLFGELVVLLAVAGLSYAAEATELTLPQYLEQLEQYASQVQSLNQNPQRAGELTRSIPHELVISTQRGKVSVPIAFLRDGLTRFQQVGPKVKGEIVPALTQRLELMREEASEYEKPSEVPIDGRAKLARILSAREFRQVHGPTALELVRDRIMAWLDRMLRKASPRAPNIANLGQIVIWICIAAAVSVLAVWLYRVSRSRLMHGTQEIVPFLPSGKSWRIWLAEAHEKASSGQWRDAIHLAFWAGVSRLEAQGVWHPDSTRTPREYLNAIPPTSQARIPFRTLTEKFEAVWYGGRASSQVDFREFVAGLEKLG